MMISDFTPKISIKSSNSNTLADQKREYYNLVLTTTLGYISKFDIESSTNLTSAWFHCLRYHLLKIDKITIITIGIWVYAKSSMAFGRDQLLVSCPHWQLAVYSLPVRHELSFAWSTQLTTFNSPNKTQQNPDGLLYSRV